MFTSETFKQEIGGGGGGGEGGGGKRPRRKDFFLKDLSGQEKNRSLRTDRSSLKMKCMR